MEHAACAAAAKGLAWAYTIFWAGSLQGHNEQGGFIEAVPDPVTATADGVFGSAYRCGERWQAGDCALTVANLLMLGRAGMMTPTARAATLSVYLRTAPLDLEAADVAAMRAFQSDAPAIWRPVDPILFWQAGGLRSVAKQAHALSLDLRRMRGTTVALAIVRLEDGRRVVFAAGSRNSLSASQAEFLQASGVSPENIVRGSDSLVKKYWTEQDEFGDWELQYGPPPVGDPLAWLNHAEQAIRRHLPPGAVVEEWGISWAGKQKPLPCPNCTPSVCAAPLQFDAEYFLGQ